jgi:hypothetical protein
VRPSGRRTLRSTATAGLRDTGTRRFRQVLSPLGVRLSAAARRDLALAFSTGRPTGPP